MENDWCQQLSRKTSDISGIGTLNPDVLSMYEWLVIVLLFIYCYQIYDFTAEDLEDMGEIGRGNFGSVSKMLHIKTNTVMAVKVTNTTDCQEALMFQLFLLPVIAENSIHCWRKRTETTFNGLGSCYEKQ